MNHLKQFKERRSTQCRRKFTYTAYSPERRSGKDRRVAITLKPIAKVA